MTTSTGCDATAWNRRTVLKGLGVAAAAGALGRSARASSAEAGKEPFVGVQVGSHSMFDEGIDRCLDLLQENAAANAIFLYATGYHGFDRERPLAALAADHGVEPRDPQTRQLPLVWMKTHERFYRDTFLKPWQPTKDFEYFDRDLFAEVAEPAAKRGIRVYARMLEPFKPIMSELVPGWSKIVTRDIDDKPTSLPCWNHPAYQAWWLGTVEDLFTNYPLAGLKWGAERSGPLSELLQFPLGETPPPGCFCEHCQAFARDRRVDAEQARKGFRELHRLIQQSRKLGERPVDGMFVTMLRVFLDYPEVLAWERLWHEAMENLARRMHQSIKRLRPDAELGRHVWHAVSFDPLYRAATDYARLVPHSDWIKPVVYHDTALSRFRFWTLRPLCQGLLAEVPEEEAGRLLYRVLGYDVGKEAPVSDKNSGHWSPDYVHRETKRCVADVAGKIPVYAGVGFDLPGQKQPSDPERLKQAVYGAFEAGAAGLVLSREYDEMRVSSLKACGEAIRQYASSLPRETKLSPSREPR